MGRVRTLAVAGAVLVAAGGCSWVGRVGVSATGAQPVSGAIIGTDVSPTGRFVVFDSDAPNLVSNDTNNAKDVFLRDNQLGTTVRISVGANGAQANHGGYGGKVSADGKFVAFTSDSDNLISGDTNASTDVFLRSVATGTTTRVSVKTAGGQSNGSSILQAMTPDAKLFVFTSEADNLIGLADENFSADIYLRDRIGGSTTRISVATDGSEGDSDSSVASISDDGRYVAFASNSSNFDVNDSGIYSDIFLRDLTLSTTTRLTGLPNGAEGDGESTNVVISGDGSTVIFDSDASNLVASPDENFQTDVYSYTVATGVRQRISTAYGGGDSDDFSVLAGVSDNGQYVAFQSAATNLLSAPSSGLPNTFVRDRATGITTLGGSTQQQAEPSDPVDQYAGSSPHGISGDGRYILFSSAAKDVIAAGDANGNVADLFLRSNPIPFFFAATPSTLTRGTTVTVSFAGNNLHANSLVLLGDGITVNSVTAVGTTKLDVNVTVASNAPVGVRTPVIVDQGTGGGPSSGGLAFLPGLITVA